MFLQTVVPCEKKGRNLLLNLFFTFFNRITRYNIAGPPVANTLSTILLNDFAPVVLKPLLLWLFLGKKDTTYVRICEPGALKRKMVYRGIVENYV